MHDPARFYRRGQPVPIDPNAIRGGSGLGDAIYLQAVCRDLIAKGRKGLIVCTDYPEVFAPIAKHIRLKAFQRDGIGILGHYSMRRQVQETTQFEDCCIQAGIMTPVELKLDWQVQSKCFGLREHGKPIAVVGLPRAPMGRTDGYGRELLPHMKVYQSLVDMARDKGYLTVQLGSGRTLHNLSGIDVDLSNQTTVADLIDIVAISDAVICYPSFLVPMAEALDKRYVSLFANEGMKAPNGFLRWITPNKIIHRKDLGSFIIDDDEPEMVTDATKHIFG